MYNNEHQGTLPLGYWHGVGAADGADSPPNGAGVMAAFARPTALEGRNTSGRILHYASHPRLMPLLHTTDGATGRLARPYKISQIKRSSEIILVFDAMQDMTAEGNVVLPAAIGLDEDGYFHNVTRAGRSWNFLVTNSRIDPNIAVFTPNVDWMSWGDPILGAWSFSKLRWRHGRNDVANFVFADGHAETRRLKLRQNADLKLGNVYVDRAN
jgi:prepilin-type processing-associated H-X9-DG protein